MRVLNVNFSGIFIKEKELWLKLAENSSYPRLSYRGSTVFPKSTKNKIVQVEREAVFFPWGWVGFSVTNCKMVGFLPASFLEKETQTQVGMFTKFFL